MTGCPCGRRQTEHDSPQCVACALRAEAYAPDTTPVKIFVAHVLCVLAVLTDIFGREI